MTWTKDVAPIIQRRCRACHSVGGAAASSDLSTYEAAKVQARAIRQEVLDGRMPPWPAAKGLGDFTNDASLSPIEIELLTAWADGDAPLGPVDAAHLVVESPVVAPDLVIQVPGLPIGRARTARLEVAAGNRASRLISGWGFRTGDASLVDRVVLSVVGGGQIGSWVPGDAPVRLPPAVAQRLPSGATLAIELYFRKSSATEMPASTLELSFREAAGRRLRHRSLGCGASSIGDHIEALAITPMAAAAGDSIEIVAQHPGGRIEPLVVIPQFDPAYPVTYRFRKPVPLSGGTTIRVRGASPGCNAELEFSVRASGRLGGPPQ